MLELVKFPKPFFIRNMRFLHFCYFSIITYSNCRLHEMIINCTCNQQMVDSVSFYFMCSTYSINDICFNLKCSSFFTFIQSIDIHSLYFHTQRKLKRKDFFSFLNVIVVLSFQTILDEIFGSSKFNIQCHGKKIGNIEHQRFRIDILGYFR